MENNNISEQDYCTDFAKIYEFAHGYEIELISIYCYK